MRQAFASIFGLIPQVIGMLARVVNAADNLAAIAEDEAIALRAEMAAERKAKTKA